VLQVRHFVVALLCTRDFGLNPVWYFLCRVVPQESGGRASRNQPYTLLTVTGDAVLLDYATDTARFSGFGDVGSGGVAGIERTASESTHGIVQE
jgi:hypothetical protein